MCSTNTKMVACLFAPTCFALGTRVINLFEGGLTGVQSNNAGIQVENISFNAVVSMLVHDFVLYSLIAWYLDKVLNSEPGGRQRFYFLCSSTFWSGKRKYNQPPCTASQQEQPP